MILACGQTSPAAASNSLHFYDRVLRKKLTTTHFLGELLLRSVSGGVVFQQLRFVILPVQTKSTADCLGGGASGCICFAGSNEINRRLSERGCVSLLFFKPVETRLNGDCLSGVRQLASAVEPE